MGAAASRGDDVIIHNFKSSGHPNAKLAYGYVAMFDRLGKSFFDKFLVPKCVNGIGGVVWPCGCSGKSWG